MTLYELKRRLDEEGIRLGAYDFDKTQKDEVYCLEETPSGWTFYYRERGIHRDERVFAFEQDACRFFLKLILRDPTTRVLNEVKRVLE